MTDENYFDNSPAINKSCRNRDKVIEACQKIYGDFDGNFISSSDTPDVIRSKINAHINDPSINIDLYIYIADCHILNNSGSCSSIVKRM